MAYDVFGLRTKTALGPQSGGQFLLASNNDIYFIVPDDETPGTPPAVAVHVLTAANNYQGFGLRTKTALGPQSGGQFLLASNNDIYFIVPDDETPGTPPAVAVHVLTAANNYQGFGLRTKTALGPQSGGQFLLASNNDIYFIVPDDETPGTPPAVAVHVLTAANNYQGFGLRTKTALGPQSGGQFLLASNNDIYFIVPDDETPGTPPAVAVHVLTAANNYQGFGLRTKTALGPQSGGQFLLASNNDIYFIVPDDETPGTPPAVAVHVLLSAESEDEASLQAYNDCLKAQGNGLGNVVDMGTAFVNGDLPAYLQAIYNLNQQALKDQGCLGHLTPAMKAIVLTAQQNFRQTWQQLHPGEAV